MISRLTLSAAVFSFIVTTGLAVAADGRSQQRTAVSATAAMPAITLPRVEVIGHRHAQP
jgi:hypothetical protein